MTLNLSVKNSLTQKRAFYFPPIAGIEAAPSEEPQSYNAVDSPLSRNEVKIDRDNEESVRRFTCPAGFFRLKRQCYYLSSGQSTWRDAYFHCRDRNATLAILDRKGKEKMLRKYMSGDQFSKFMHFAMFVFRV